MREYNQLRIAEEGILVIDLIRQKVLVVDGISVAVKITKIDANTIRDAVLESHYLPGRYMIGGYQFIYVTDFMRRPFKVQDATKSRYADSSYRLYEHESADRKTQLLGPKVEVLAIDSGVILEFISLKKATAYFGDSFYHPLKLVVTADNNIACQMDNPLYAVNGKIYKSVLDTRSWADYIDTSILLTDDKIDIGLVAKEDYVDVPWKEDAPIVVRTTKKKSIPGVAGMTQEDKDKLEKYLIDNMVEKTFVSEAAEYNFYLTKLDGGERLTALGVKQLHYFSLDKANAWFFSISKKLNDDHETYAEAFKNLEKIYGILTGQDSSEPLQLPEREIPF